MNPTIQNQKKAVALMMAANGEGNAAGGAGAGKSPAPSAPSPAPSSSATSPAPSAPPAAPSDPSSDGTSQEGKEQGKDKGKGKGRPAKKIPIALACAAWLGLPLQLRFFRGDWYFWPDARTDAEGKWKGEDAGYGVWYKLQEKTCFCIVNGWLQVAFPQDATPTLAKFIMEYLQSSSLCEVNQETVLPCFLDGREGARNWVVLKNCAVDIVAFADGAPPEKTTMPHSPHLFSLHLLPFEFDPLATCPLWEKFLAEQLPDAASREMLQMMFGLCLTYETRCHVFFILYGPPRSGKSVTVSILKELVGKTMFSALDVEELNEKHSKGDLAEKKINIIKELPPRLPSADKSKITAFLKGVSAGEIIKVEHKNKEPEYKESTARIIACANKLPNFNDDALLQRMRVIPFEIVVEDSKIDTALADKLRGELPGIFNWAIRGGLGMLRNKYNMKFPRLGKGATIVESEREDADPLENWIRDHYEHIAGERSVVALSAYDKYKAACEESGEKPLPSRAFYREVKRVFGLGRLKDVWLPINEGRKKFWVFDGLREKIQVDTLDVGAVEWTGEAGARASEVGGVGEV